MSPFSSVQSARMAAGSRDQVRLVERLAMPGQASRRGRGRFVLDVGIAADPGAVNLPGNQQRRDLLIGAPRDQFDRTADLETK